jgi:hypothetical protein
MSWTREYLNTEFAGWDVSISKDGNTFAASNPELNTIRIFGFSNGSWTSKGSITGTSETFTGQSISINQDGTVIAIGKNRFSSGSGGVDVYTYVSGTTWAQRGSTFAIGATGDYSGYSVSISNDGTRVVVGSLLNDTNSTDNGLVKVFSWSGSAWNQLGSDLSVTSAGYSGLQMGTSVAISGDGTTIIARGFRDTDATNGTTNSLARSWSWNGSSWSQKGSDFVVTISTDGVSSKQSSVSLSNDGSILAIGDEGFDNFRGQVKVWKFSSGAWSQLGSSINGNAVDDLFGTSVSLNSAGDMVAIGAPKADTDGLTNNGAAYLYRYSSINSQWAMYGTSIKGSSTNQWQGYSVSLNSSGSKLIIGAGLNGAAAYGGSYSVWNYINNSQYFLPTTYNNLGIWLDAADTNSLEYDVSINKWNDKSGAGKLLLPATNRPSVGWDGTTGLNVARFNGANSMSVGLTPATDAPLVLTAFCVFSIDNDTTVNANGTRVFTLSKPNSGNDDNYNTGHVNLQIINSSGTITGTVAAREPGGLFQNGTYSNVTNTMHIATIQFTGTTGIYKIDGGASTVTRSDTAPFTYNTLYIGSNSLGSNGGAGQQFKGVIGELIIYNRSLTSTESSTIEGYLAWKWGLQTNLPGGHLFRNAAPTSSNTSVLSIVRPVSTNLALWLDADDTSTIVRDGSNVSQWLDKSGSNKNMSRVTSGPAYQTNVINNRPSLYFNYNDGSKLLNTGFTNSSNVVSFFCVYKFNTGQSNSMKVLGFADSNNSTTNSGTINVAFDANNRTTILGAGPQHGDLYGFHIISGLFNGSTLRIRIDGGASASSTAYTSTFNYSKLIVGGNANGEYPLFGYISEVLVYNSALSDTNVNEIEGYLAWKWGLTYKLPGLHPYKNSVSLNIPTSLSSPSAITNLATWLDSADSVYVTTTGSAITQWLDRSNNGRSVIPIDSANKPIYTTNVQNGLPSILIDSSGFSGSLTNTGNTLSVFIVMRYNSGNTDGRRLLSLANNGVNDFDSSSNLAIAYKDGSGTSILRNSTSIISHTPVTNAFYIINAVFTGTQGIYRANGSSLPTIVSSSGNFNYSNYFVGYGSNGTQGIKGYISEVVVYNKALTDAEREDVEGYLSVKWGLTSQLPNLHPYRSASITIPAAPVLTSATAADGKITITLTQSGTVTNYKYSLDNGLSYTDLSPAQTNSPIIIKGIPNSQTYTLRLKAFNGTESVSSNSLSVTMPSKPATHPSNYANMAAWLDAADPFSVDVSGSLVTKWTDKSTYSGDVVPLSTGYPSYAYNVTNNFPAILFTKSPTSILSGNLSNSSNTVSVFCVYRFNNPTALNRVFSFGGNLGVSDASDTFLSVSYSDTSGTLIKRGAVNTTINHTDLLNSFHIVSVIYNGTTGEFRINGGTASTVSTSANFGYSKYYIGGNALSSAHDGYVAELITYNSALSSTQRQDIEGYLAWKWDIENKLPSGHSYSTTSRSVPTDAAAYAIGTIYPPKLLSATPSDRTITVNFNPGIYANGTITNYAYSTDNGATYKLLPLSSPATITTPSNSSTSLTNLTSYTINIKSVVDASYSDASSTIVATPARAPAQPNITYTIPGSFAAQLVISQPTVTGAYAVTNYAYSTDGSNYTALVPASTSTTLTIPLPANGQTYTIYLKAIAGPFESTVVSTSVTLPAAPSFSPANIANLDIWIDANSMNVGTITNLTNRFDSNNNFIRSAGTTYPQVILDTSLNNNKVISFAGETYESSQTKTYVPNAMTVFAIIKRNTYYYGGVLKVKDAGLTDMLFYDYAASGSAHGVPIGGPEKGGNTAYIFVNGSRISGPDNKYVSYHILSMVVGSTTSYNSIMQLGGIYGNVCEILIYRSKLRSAEIRTVEGYLAHKWGLQSLLPSTHHFKTVAPTFVPAFLPSDVALTATDFWLDASKLSGLSDGSGISTWIDRSPNVYSGTAVSSPLYRTNSANGLPVIRFNGTSQYIDFGNVLNIGTAPIYVFAVYKHSDTTSTPVFGKTSSGANSGRWGIYRTTLPATYSFVDINGTVYQAGNTDAATTNLLLTNSTWDRSNLTIFTNGTQKGTVAASDSSFLSNSAQLLVGGFGNASGTGTPSSFMNGDIAELIVYRGNLTTVQRQMVEGYLAHKWGLQNSLPSTGHSYRSAAPGKPSKPTITAILPANSSANVYVLQYGDSPLTGYQYYLNDASTNILSVSQTTSPLTLTSGLTNGSSYTLRVRAVNGTETSDFSEPMNTGIIGVRAPDAPINLSATPGFNVLDISFNAPGYNGGATITNYQYSIVDGSWNNLGVDAATNGFRIEGLTNGQTYTVTIRAVNSVGPGTTANISSIVGGRPSKPRNIVAVAGNTIIDVSFNTPLNDGGVAITSYEWTRDNINWVNIGLNTDFRVTGLTNTTSYTIRIRAVNPVGSGEEETATATPIGPPDAPTSVTAAPRDSAIDVSFNFLGSNGGSPVLRYEYKLDSSNNAGIWTDISLNTVFSLSGLTNGTPYTISVRAVNSLGEGAIRTTVATPRTISGPPTNLVAAYGNTFIDISFNAPTFNGGSAITRYEYRSDASSVNSWIIGIWTDISLNTSARVSGLTNGTEYRILVRAVTAAGSGSEASVIETPKTVPSIPLNFTATPGNTIIFYSFATPATTGGSPIIRYEYQKGTDTSWNNIGLSTSFRVTNLTNGTAYTTKVRAVNAVGESSIATVTVATIGGVPSEPINLQAVAAATTIDVSFNAPISTGGIAISRYEYSIVDSSWVSIGTATSFRVSSLTTGRLYTVQLRAVNSIGNGPVAFVRARTTGAPYTVNYGQITSYTHPLTSYTHVDGSQNYIFEVARLDISSVDITAFKNSYSNANFPTWIITVNPAFIAPTTAEINDAKNNGVYARLKFKGSVIDNYGIAHEIRFNDALNRYQIIKNNVLGSTTDVLPYMDYIIDYVKNGAVNYSFGVFGNESRIILDTVYFRLKGAGVNM